MRPTSPFARKAFGLFCPLAFSVMGLVVDGAVVVAGSNQLAPGWRFALVAGAPALAAIAAIKLAGDDLGDWGSGNHLGRR